MLGALSAWTMHFREVAGRHDGQSASRESLFAGIRFIRHTEILLGAILVDLLAVLFGGAVALLPIYARRSSTSARRARPAESAAPAVGALLATPS